MEEAVQHHVERDRQQRVHDVHVLADDVDDPAERGRVEEAGGGAQQVADDAHVQHDGGVAGPHRSDDDRGKHKHAYQKRKPSLKTRINERINERMNERMKELIKE